MTSAHCSRLENLLGTLATTLSDEIVSAVTQAAGQGGAVPAALVQIADHPGLTLDDLRRRLGMTHSGIVRTIGGLAERELVERRRSATDARAVQLRLTRAGRRRVERIRGARARVLAEALASVAEEDQDVLRRLLETVLDALPQDPDHSTRMCRLCDLSSCPSPDCPVEQRYLAFVREGHPDTAAR